MRIIPLLFSLLLIAATPSQARIEALDFDNENQEELYNKLTDELRCLVCQNQNIADSNAELATDLRHKTYKLVKEGKQENEIKQWMVDRYGDFVLYKPPFETKTLVLWLGPMVLFFIAVVVVVRIAAKRKNKDEIDESQKQQIEQMLNQKGRK